MNLELNYEGFENYLLKRTFHDTGLGVYPIGVQYVFKFDNGFGASVIKRWFSYGGQEDLWELGVLIFDDEGNYHLTYDTPITGDVEGYLSDEEVRNLLKEIQEL